MVKVFIDPGHGGTDPGAVGNGLREKDLTLTISKKIESTLKGVATVKLSRTNDKTLSLAQRTKMANDWGADYFLSVHINAGGGTGYEDYIYNGSVSSKTVSIRDTIHAEIVKQIPEVRNRGKKRANFAVVRSSKMPAMLTENLFIDTKADADLLKNNAFLDKVAVGHANGLIKAFNLKGTVSKPATSAKTSKPAPKPSTSNKANLKVDGYEGPETIKAEQRYFSTPVDGEISSPSMVVKARQRLLGVKADGYAGPITIRAEQRRYGTPVDGKISRPSMVIKERQRRLNKGKL